MPIRNEHGKPRMATPRLKDLSPSGTERERSEGRDEKGRAAPGNTLATGRGFKAAIRKWLGAVAGDKEAEELARDARVIFLGTLRSLPSTGPLVRAEAAAHARRVVLGGYYMSKAAEAGLNTTEGRALAELSLKHDQAATRHGTAARAQANLEAASRPASDPLDLGSVVEAPTVDAWAESLAKATAAHRADKPEEPEQ